MNRAEVNEMTMNREHTLELLTLLAVIAIVQLPGKDLPGPTQDFSTQRHGTSFYAVEYRTEAVETGSPHRLDPVALLQASVPENWRIEIPPVGQSGPRSLSC